MSADRILIERIEHVAIMVTDMDRARTFYADILGMSEVPRPPTFDFPGAWFRNGPTDLHLISRPQADAASRRHVAFMVSDLQQAARVLEARGFPVLWEYTLKIANLDRFFTADPDNNRIELMGQSPAAT